MAIDDRVLHTSSYASQSGIATTRDIDTDLDRTIFSKGYSKRAIKIKYGLLMLDIEERCRPLYSILTGIGLPNHNYEARRVILM